MKKIVVTGGNGLLGKYIVAELESHYAVSVIDTAGDDPIDVLDLAAVKHALEGHDGVIHLAGIDVAVPAADEAYFRTNVLGTWNVLHAAEVAGHAKAVICSSVSAVGFSDAPPLHAPAYLPVDEDHPLRPTHPYGLSKQVMEDIGRSFAARGALRVVTIRPSLVVYPHIVADVEKLVQHEDGEATGALPGALVRGARGA